MSEVKQIDIDTLTGRELDAAVAVVIMGWSRHARYGGILNSFKSPNGRLYDTPYQYSTDANRAREVEAEIERRGLVERYVKIMVDDIAPPLGLSQHFVNGLTRIELFKLITATPEQRCRAALKVVMSG